MCASDEALAFDWTAVMQHHLEHMCGSPATPHRKLCYNADPE